MRILGVIFLSLTPFLFGMEYKKSLKNRRDFLSRFNEFVMFVKEQIRFCGRERDEIFSLALTDPRFNHPLFKKLEIAFKNQETLTKIVDITNDIRLNSKEIYEIEAFVFGLGKNDTEGQINHCDYYISVFRRLGIEATEAYSVKSRLTVGLSICLSVAMFIIMI